MTKCSNLRNIHRAGKNLAVADMQSRTFPTIKANTCHLKHKALPPHIEVTHLPFDNSLE